MIHRFSSRRQPLDASFIKDRLKGAVSYDRIAVFFRSSLLEMAGEQLEALDGKIRVVCNSEIDQRDVSTAKAAQQALRKAGQVLDEIYVYNMRYQGSVEDRVHELLSSRLEDIHGLFGQIPDVLEDVWIDVANGEIEDAKKLIESVDPKHPFDAKYNKVSDIDWESCATIIEEADKKRILVEGW